MQTTGIALETSHFTMVTHGTKSSEIKSEGTLRLYPFLQELLQHGDKKTYGTFFSNLNTKVCSSTKRLFPNVDFIDTPGLTDGNVKYNCDIIEVMKWLCKYVDLVLVFLDPVGQGLCNKTIDMIEFLAKDCPEKLKIFLSKADQIQTEEDLNKLYYQISASISDRLNFQHGINIYPFTILEKELPFTNKLELVNKEIESSLGYKIERNMTSLTNDLIFVKEHCEFLEHYDNLLKKQKLRVILLRIFAFLVFVLILLCNFKFIEVCLNDYSMAGLSIFALVLVVVSFMIDRKPFTSLQRSRITR